MESKGCSGALYPASTTQYGAMAAVSGKYALGLAAMCPANPPLTTDALFSSLAS